MILLNFILGLSTLSPNALGTAEFLLFFDKLFDSMNGTSVRHSEGKHLRVAVTSTSPHHDFWIEAIKILNTISFQKGTKRHVPPTVRNWIFTIKVILFASTL